MTEYDAVVFDNDGVLVELTEMDVLRAAARDAFADVGVPEPDERFVEAAAYGDLDGLEAVESRHDVALSALWEARERHAIDRQRALVRDGGKPFYDDVAHLADIDAALGVVSNNQHATVETVVAELDRFGLAEAVETVYGRDPTLAGAGRRKPETHYLDRALDDLGTRDALYVGDSEKDVVTAQRAGVDSVFLRRSHRSDLTLSVDPTAEFDSLAGLVGWLTGR